MSYTLHHANALTALPSLPADTFDIALCDPPYSETTHKGARSADRGVGAQRISKSLVTFDSMTFPQVRELLGECGRVTRRWVVATMGWQHVAKLEESPPAGLRFVRFGVWVKPNATPQFTGDRPAQGWEAVAILHRTGGKMTWTGGGSPAVWTVNAETHAGYPTQKPLAILRSFLALFSAGGPVLDPTCGSATSGVAAVERGLDWTGYDVSEEAIFIARERLDAAFRQSSLFTAEKAKQERFEL